MREWTAFELTGPADNGPAGAAASATCSIRAIWYKHVPGGGFGAGRVPLGCGLAGCSCQ